MRIALAQTNSTVGDIQGNSRLVVEHAQGALEAGAQVVVFPELAVSGYPPEDLLLKDHFIQDCAEALEEIARDTQGIVVVVGLPIWDGRLCYNAAAVLAEGEVVARYRKILLPNYGVFDEKRYFQPGEKVVVVKVAGVRMAVTICEDIWKDGGPGEIGASEGGASVILNLSMSPYHRGKGDERADMLAKRAADTRAFVCYANGVGGQDELVFDGQSLVVDPQGELVGRARQFEEDLLVVDIDGVAEDHGAEGAIEQVGSWPVEEVEISSSDGPTTSVISKQARISERLDADGEIYQALCLGVHDYVCKNGFERAVIGISGGIDSALTACIAADALGSDKVTLVSMPSRFSSEGTKCDAQEIAERLGVGYVELPIESLFAEYLTCLEPYLEKGNAGVTEQNIQARIRGNLLMALSNEFGWLVLTTGNKSEMAVGYATLYGDMAGGFAVLKDVPKTLVYRLAEYRNSLDDGEGPIPRSTITRAPSAELAPDQVDQDALPPYEVLDQIIKAYVVNDESFEEMVAAGMDGDVVRKVVAMIDGNEYKRRQSAPGVRITPKAFGKDRRLPITNRYRG